MSKISADDVKKLAILAGLTVTDNETTQLAEDIQKIIGYIEQLNELDTSKVSPTYQVTGLTSVMRDDTLIEYGVSHDELLKNSPAHLDGSLKVKRVL